MKTFHNEAKPGQIAGTVLMPGDPLRAKYIADTYLSDVVCYNRVRGMNGYTGYYEGKRISVQGSGMGIPSMGIYAYELYQEYDVDTIIRIGTAGAVHRDVEIGNLILAMGCCTNSNFAGQYHLPGTFAPIADFGLLEAAPGQEQPHPLLGGQCIQFRCVLRRPQRGKGGMGEDGRTGPGNGDPVPLLHSRPHR